MRDAMSAVATFASMVDDATKGAVRKARNAKLLVDLAAILLIKLLPRRVANQSDIRYVPRIAFWIWIFFEAHGGILCVVVTPVESRRIAEPLFLAG
jgi:hypothetical protein